jgi:hypothetical protein
MNQSKSPTKKAKTHDEVIHLSSDSETELEFKPAEEAANSTQTTVEASASFYEDRTPGGGGGELRQIPTYSEISSQENYDDSVVFVSQKRSELEEGEIVSDSEFNAGVIVVDDNSTLVDEIIDVDAERTITPASPLPDFIPLPKSDSPPRKRKRNNNKKKTIGSVDISSDSSHTSASSNTSATASDSTDKRMIIIDGSNVAFG